ncbi:MAG: efflux RND transporter periplasmic adaptor subunit, partial [bacterium]
PNPERALRPGRFVRVIAVFPDEPEAVLIPQRAVLQEQGGSYVWLVQEDGTVQRRAIRLGRMLDRLQQVEEGLSDGERVVVDGVQGLRSGDPVQVRSEPEPEAEPEPEPG